MMVLIQATGESLDVSVDTLRKWTTSMDKVRAQRLEQSSKQATLVLYCNTDRWAAAQFV